MMTPLVLIIALISCVWFSAFSVFMLGGYLIMRLTLAFARLFKRQPRRLPRFIARLGKYEVGVHV